MCRRRANRFSVIPTGFWSPTDANSHNFPFALVRCRTAPTQSVSTTPRSGRQPLTRALLQRHHVQAGGLSGSALACVGRHEHVGLTDLRGSDVDGIHAAQAAGFEGQHRQLKHGRCAVAQQGAGRIAEWAASGAPEGQAEPPINHGPAGSSGQGSQAIGHAASGRFTQVRHRQMRQSDQQEQVFLAGEVQSSQHSQVRNPPPTVSRAASPAPPPAREFGGGCRAGRPGSSPPPARLV